MPEITVTAALGCPGWHMAGYRDNGVTCLATTKEEARRMLSDWMVKLGFESWSPGECLMRSGRGRCSIDEHAAAVKAADSIINGMMGKVYE